MNITFPLAACGTVVLAALLTSTCLAENHEPSTSGPARDLAAMTMVMDSIPDIIF